MDCNDALAVDADIAGRGVRISFYIQNILLGACQRILPKNCDLTLLL
jgi:hypothetical protein